jgi:hypothetical protein
MLTFLRFKKVNLLYSVVGAGAGGAVLKFLPEAGVAKK